MKTEAKVLLALSVAVIVAAIGGAFVYKRNEAQSKPAPAQVASRPELVRDDSPSLGPLDAKVTIVEFLDPECESCKAFHPIMKVVLKKYEGRVRFVVRYMMFHSSSNVAVAATEAAGRQGQYWEMQELLFEKAEEWGHQHSPRFDLFYNYAHMLGLDLDRYNRDSTDPAIATKAHRDMTDGKALGVVGTPTIFVNGAKLGNLSQEALEAEIERHL